MPEIQIPQGLGDLTPEWLGAAIGSHLGLEQIAVTEARLTPLNTEAGFVSDIQRVGL